MYHAFQPFGRSDFLMSTLSDTIRVLHVDDEPDFAEMAASFLEREDDRFAVETATNASEGLDRLDDGDFDAVVSDYDMPGQNGIQFLDAVREKYPELPFILYTGKGSEEIASDAISAGVTDYLQKEAGTSQYTVLTNRVRNAVERFRTRTELADQEQRLNLFFEQSPLGVIEWDETFSAVRMNDAAEGIFGYSEGDLTGRTWDAIVPESDREDVDNVVSELLENRGGYYSKNENVRKDGERIVCEWHNRVVTDAAGETVAIFSQIQDITEEHRRQQRHQRQRDALIELATDEAVVGGDFQTALRRITETATDVLGVPRVNVWLFDERDEVSRCVDHYDRRTDTHDSGMTLAVSEYPAYYDALESEWAIAADDAREDPRTAELTEGYLDVHDVGALLDAPLRSGGELIGVVCHEHVGEDRDWTDDEIEFASDIGDIVHRALRNRQRQERRRESEETNAVLSSLFETLPVGVLAEDASRNVLAVNDRMLELFEIPGTPETVIGADCERMAEQVSDMFVDADGFLERITELLATREPTDNEELPLRDGRTFERWHRPIELSEGDGHLWMYRDATDRKERETRLRGLNETMQRLMGADTREQISEIGVEAASEILGLDTNALNLYDDERAALVPIAETDSISELIGDLPTFTDGDSIAWRAYERGGALVVDDVHADPDVYNPETPIESELHLPLGEYGLLIAGSETSKAFGQQDLIFGKILAGGITAALGQIERTEQVRARERELARKNDRLEALFENSPDMIDVLDPDGTLLDVNRRFCEELGYEEADVLGRPIWEIDQLVDEDDVRGLLSGFDPDERRKFEGVYERRDGSTVPVEVHLLRFGLEGADRFLAISRDITERKEHEQEREATIEFLQNLYDVATDRELTADGKISQLLAAGPETLGLPYGHLTRIERAEDELGDGTQTVLEASGDHELLQPGSSCPLSRSYCRKTIEQEGLLEIQNALTTGWGDDPAYEMFNLACYIGTSITVDGELYGTVFFASKTPREDPFTDAERTFVRLTSQLVSYELERKQATSKLKRQNERLEEFASIVSHDLRNPLNVAQGRLELANEEIESEHLEHIANAHERMNALIDDLLALAREGRPVDDFESVDLTDLTENCWRNVATAEATLATGAERVLRADRSRLQQLLENLIRNAVEHGGDDVTVTVGALDDGFYIEDDGPGIPEGELDKVFDAGYSTAEGGTGFGLSIVKQVAEAHGWELRLTDGSDGGARFEITDVEFEAA